MVILLCLSRKTGTGGTWALTNDCLLTGPFQKTFYSYYQNLKNRRFSRLSGVNKLGSFFKL